MNRDDKTGRPFKDLGEKIKAVRQQKKRSINEVSGAIEISEDNFKKIEQGELRPAEDTLATLLSYLEVNENEADRYWELAGYSDDSVNSGGQSTVIDLSQPIAMMMPADLKVVYTDMVHVMVNDFGVVMNFMQSTGNSQQPLAVSRIGMSKEHAKSVIAILEKSLKQAEAGTQQKLLGSNDSNDKPAKSDK